VVLRANHVDDATTTAGTELDRTWSQSEQRVVLAAADVVTWVEVCATLTNNDLAGVYQLSAEALHTEALGI